MPQKIVTYEFDINKANLEKSASPDKLIKKIHEFPNPDSPVYSLAPQGLNSWISQIRNSEQKAIDFYK
jgi:hypothetical protein